MTNQERIEELEAINKELVGALQDAIDFTYVWKDVLLSNMTEYDLRLYTDVWQRAINLAEGKEEK